MTTYIIFAGNTSGHVTSTASSYATARSGSGSSLGVNTSGTGATVGQQLGGGNYGVYQAFLTFDTSAIASTSEIVDANLALYPQSTASQQRAWALEARIYAWGGTLTTSNFRTVAQLTALPQAASYAIPAGKTSPGYLYSAGPNLISGVVKAGQTQFVLNGYNSRLGSAPSGVEYQNIGVRNIASQAAKLTVYTAPLNTLNQTSNASIGLSDGTKVSLRSSGAVTPTVQLGYMPFGSTSWTAIATLPTGTSATSFAAVDGAQAYTLASNPAGDIYVLGAQGSNTGAILVKRYARTGTTNVWTPAGALAQALPGSNVAYNSLAATWVPGTKPSIFLMAATISGYSGTNVTSYPLAYATINPTAVAASTGAMFYNYGSNPLFVPVAPAGTMYDGSLLSVAPLLANGKRIALGVNGFAAVDVVDGVVTSVGKQANGAYYQGDKIRTVGVDAAKFATGYTDAAGNLQVGVYGANGASLGSATIQASTASGGAFTTNWDIMFDRALGAIRVYYVDTTAANEISSINVSPLSFTQTAPVVVGTMGTNVTHLRVQSSPVDERSIVIEGSNNASGTLTTVALEDRQGNQTPNAPILTAQPNFDSTNPVTFTWKFNDVNSLDAQTAYQMQIQRVSDSVVVYDSGKVTTTNQYMTLPASTIANGVAYQWRVLTYDTLNTMGAWSSYSPFTTAATGTLTITDPSVEGQAGINTSSYDVKWSYVQSSGATQQQRRVRVIRTGDSVVISDTTMQSTTVTDYVVSGLSSDTEYRVEVTIINTSGVTSNVATRTFTPYYSQPMLPTVTFSLGDSFTQIDVLNPVPTGNQPDAVTNEVWRRLSNRPDLNFVRYGVISANDTYLDFQTKSNTAYDYYIITNSSTGTQVVTDTQTFTSPQLSGVWVFDPNNAETTISNFFYGNIGRKESISVESTPLQFIGRVYPVYDLGTSEAQNVSIDVTIPYGDTQDAQVQWFRTAVRARQTLCYRDNRGRIAYVVLTSIDITDVAEGTTVSSTAMTVDFTEGI